MKLSALTKSIDCLQQRHFLARLANTTDQEMLRRCFASPDWRVRLVAVKNINAQAADLDHLSADTIGVVRLAVAKHHNVGITTLLNLMIDSNSAVAFGAREHFLAKTDVPLEVLQSLAKDSDWRLRFAVALHPSITAEIVIGLMADGLIEKQEIPAKELDKIKHLFENPNADWLALKPTIRKEEIEKIETIEAVKDLLRQAMGGKREIRNAAADNKLYRGALKAAANTDLPTGKPLEVIFKRLDGLSLSPFKEVRAIVAANPYAALQTLEKLALDPQKTVRIAVAKNALTSRAALEILAKDKEAAVREAVAGNPLTPSLICLALAKDQDAKVRKAAEGSSPVKTSIKLIKESSDQAYLTTFATNDLAILRQEVAANVNSPALILEQLLSDPDTAVRIAATENPKIPAAALQKRIAAELAKAPEKRDQKLLLTIANCKTCPPEGLQSLAETAPLPLKEVIAKHHATPPVTFGLLAAQGVPSIILLIAGNIKAPPEILNQIYRRAAGSLALRLVLAGNVSLPEELLVALAADPDPLVRMAVAGNSKAPTATLEILADDKDHRVRKAVAVNKHIPEQLIERLARDSRWEVRYEAAGNSRTIKRLLLELLKSPDQNLRKAVAANRTPYLTILAQLSDDPDRQVRLAVARNPETPANYLERVFERDGHDPEFIEALVKNPQTPLGPLEQIADNPDPAIANSISGHPKIKDMIKSAKKALALNKTAMIEQYSHSRFWQVRIAIAEGLRTQNEVFLVLSKDERKEVRKTIATHLLATPAALDLLARDPSLEVQRSAIMNANIARETLLEVAGRPSAEGSIRKLALVLLA